MESNASKITERLKETARLFKRTLHWILAITLVALAGIVCYVIFCHDKSICFGMLVLVSGTLVAICALCWLGYYCKQLLGIYSDSCKQFFETELSLYCDAARREGAIQDRQIAIDPEITAKRKEIELAKIEQELKALK